MEEETTQRPKSKAWLWFLLAFGLFVGIYLYMEDPDTESAQDESDHLVE